MNNMQITPLEFKEDTRKLGSYLGDYVQTFSPAYTLSHLSEREIQEIEQEDSLDLLNSFTFYQLCECNIYHAEDKFTYFSEKMKKLFTAAYSINQAVCYGIVSNGSSTSLLLGISPGSDDDIIRAMMEGLLPGVKLEKYTSCFANSLNADRQEKDRYVGCISGVPALKIEGEHQYKDISALMRSLNGQNYTIMILCRPVQKVDIQEKLNRAIHIRDGCAAISKRSVSLQKGTSDSNTHTEQHGESEGTFKSTGFGMGLSGGIMGLMLGFNFNRASGTSHSVSDGYSDAIQKTINENQSVSFDMQNGFAVELIKMADTVIERLKTGRSIGLWESVISYSSDSEFASKIIQGSLYSEMASGIPEILPPVVFSYKDFALGKKSFPFDNSHRQQLMIPKGFFYGKGENGICSLVTSEELCGICTIPTDNTVGFQINEAKGYSLNYKASSSERTLGCICEYERPIENTRFGLSEEDLNKHTFVCGITGSGKTNTVKKILEINSKPFLVIEPAKKEYRNMSKEKNVEVWTCGRPEINCIRLNPFYILPGISPQQHIDLLKDLFNASFSFYGPMPYILEKCLYNIYTKKGWNLTLGFHPFLANNKKMQRMFDETAIYEKYAIPSHQYLFPTMQDLKNEVDDFIDHEMTYEGEVKGNIRSAIKARIDSLCVGAKGYMFNTYEMTDFSLLLNKNAVLELEGLADDADKAFSLGLLIIFINEYRQVKKETEQTDDLKHILVIEEAHRLLKNVSTEKNEDIGNPKGKAVEHFTNLLAEMRSYGQGVIVAEQIPSKLSPDVIKNSSNKIIHRIVSRDDQEFVANTIGIHTEDAIYLGNSTTGYAICHKEGMYEPVIVKVDEINTSRKLLDSKLYNSNTEEKFFAINTSILHNHLSESIDTLAFRTLITILYTDRPQELYQGLEMACELLKLESVQKNLTLILGTNLKKCMLYCIFEAAVCLMLSGTLKGSSLPSKQMTNKIQETINSPSESKIIELRHYFESYYNKHPKRKAEETIRLLFRDAYSEQKIKEFTLEGIPKYK